MDEIDTRTAARMALEAMARGDSPYAEIVAGSLFPGPPDPTLMEIRKLAMIDQMRRAATPPQPLSPVDRFVADHFVHFSTGHFDRTYSGWRVRRVRKLMEVYGIEFQGKRILELGAGIGDVGSIFADLGAEVVGLEGRAVNCNLARLRFRGLKNYQVIQFNLEDDFSKFGRFDLIINFALVEVIERFEQLLACCMKMSDTTFLETMVCDSTDPYKVIFVPMKGNFDDWPLCGRSPRPSPAYVERLFTEGGFDVHRHFDGDLNNWCNLYDWPHQNNNNVAGVLRRYWSFTKSQAPLH
jgi:SAM-dependent methyltransferase